MAILNILKESEDFNGTLRKHCKPVKEITPRTLTLLDDMKDTLVDSGGIGLAAPQVGILKRVVLVMDTEQENKIYELINPEIIYKEGEQNELEGCLSVPDIWGFTKRPMKVTAAATDRDGNRFEITGEGLLARELCHELDHLDGVLFTDIATKLLTSEELEEATKGND